MFRIRIAVFHQDDIKDIYRYLKVSFRKGKMVKTPNKLKISSIRLVGMERQLARKWQPCSPPLHHAADRRGMRLMPGSAHSARPTAGRPAEWAHFGPISVSAQIANFGAYYPPGSDWRNLETFKPISTHFAAGELKQCTVQIAFLNLKKIILKCQFKKNIIYLF